MVKKELTGYRKSLSALQLMRAIASDVTLVMKRVPRAQNMVSLGWQVHAADARNKPIQEAIIIVHLPKLS